MMARGLPEVVEGTPPGLQAWLAHNAGHPPLRTPSYTLMANRVYRVERFDLFGRFGQLTFVQVPAGEPGTQK